MIGARDKWNGPKRYFKVELSRIGDWLWSEGEGKSESYTSQILMCVHLGVAII
jgi:hypothetical protein